MKEDKKSSIIKEALTDFNAIKEAANNNAKKRLAEEFPEKFNNLLKEEINKNKTAKESYKKIDDTEESEESDKNKTKKEPVMKKQEKETEKVEEVVNITDTVGDGDPFKEKAKKSAKIVENAGKDGVYTENPKKALQTEEFDITELDAQSVGTALEGADDDDEIITMNEIEEEIASMQGLGEEIDDMGNLPQPELEKRGSVENQGGDAFNQLVGLKNQLDEILNGMNGNNSPVEEEQYQDNSPIEEEEITDDDVMAVLGGNDEEQPVEETIANNYPNQRATTASIPNREHKPESAVNKMRYGLRENETKIGGLIEENKKLTKKLNETKKYKQSVTTLVEQYKSALEKYRNQLREMATFNTNLAHVNNLLVNESLALTQEDKIKIINEFKKVDSITESQKKYKAILTEMQSSTKTLTESIETKVSASIQPSSKQKLDEVIEKTAYENDEHINKMKKLIEYVENRGKKKII